jgi:hypothetical protein
MDAGSCSFGDKGAGMFTECLLTNHIHLIAKLGMLEAVFIPSKNWWCDAK